MKYLIAYILFVLTSVSAIAQVDVKGVVVDDENKEPLVGASIIIKDTDNKIKEGEACIFILAHPIFCGRGHLSGSVVSSGDLP